MNSIKVIITIDTEWDRKNKSAHITVKNLSRISHFQKLCDKYGIKPVYFCTYEALKNRNFVDFIIEYVQTDKVEIGAHLHPWSTPPFPYGGPLEEQNNTSFPHEYPLDIFYNKLKSLSELIKENFNISPISYRAGRFGFILEHIPLLSKLGFKIDSSITPHVSHINIKGWKETGIDFSKYTNLNPKRLNFQNSSIIEMPITILPFEHFFINIIKKVLRIKWRQRWFRIYPETTILDLKKIIKYAKNKEINYLVYMMHSNEFHYETNPYFDTLEKQKELFKLLEEFFQEINNFKLESITFKDYLNNTP